MESINILIDYFSLFRLCEVKGNNDVEMLDFIDKIIDTLGNTDSKKTNAIVDFDALEKLVHTYDIGKVIDEYYSKKKSKNIELCEIVKNGKDAILYDLFLHVSKYNNYITKKEIYMSTIMNDKNEDIDLFDILNYLEIKKTDIDPLLLEDISNYGNLEDMRKLATDIKTDTGLKRVLFDKIEDKNILLSILLHSNKKRIDKIIEIFSDEGVNINKVINSIPSIFIEYLVSSKCKYRDIEANYSNFIDNYELINKYKLSFKKMLNQPVFLINDNNENTLLINKLESYSNSIIKGVLEHIGSKFILNSSIVLSNIELLISYDIKLDDPDCYNGYTILAMDNLKEKIEYLINAKIADTNNKNLNYWRNLIYNDSRKTCKQHGDYGIIYSPQN